MMSLPTRTRITVMVLTTHMSDLIKVACLVYTQGLDCNFTSLVLTLPHFGEPAVELRGTQTIATKWNLH